MSARSVCSGCLTFGLVTVPVKVYTAASSESISFNYLTPTSVAAGTPRKAAMPLIDPDNGEKIDRASCPRGYEHMKDQFVVFSAEEIKALDAVKNNCIEISEFVEIKEIDFVQVEDSYYLKPDKGGDKGYKLLANVMKEKGRVAIAQWVYRGKEHLALIRPYKGGLILHRLYYSNEVRDFEDNCAVVNISDVENQVAAMLIDKHTKPMFDVKQYHDQHIDRVMAAVETKKAGGNVVFAAAPVVQSNDMLAAMQAMLAGESVTQPAAPEVTPEKPKKAKGKKHVN
jgi:DNA end-binding protein Ku